MTTAAAGSLSLAQYNLRVAVSKSSTFKTWTGETTDADALARVYDEALPPPETGTEYDVDDLAELKPYALVCTQSFKRAADSMTDGPYANASGVLALMLVQDVASGDTDLGEISRKFQNVIGGIIDDLWTYSQTAGAFVPKTIAMNQPWYRSSNEDMPGMGDELGVILLIEWEGI